MGGILKRTAVFVFDQLFVLLRLHLPHVHLNLYWRGCVCVCVSMYVCESVRALRESMRSLISVIYCRSRTATTLMTLPRVRVCVCV